MQDLLFIIKSIKGELKTRKLELIIESIKWELKILFINYESTKRKLKTKYICGCRCYERLQTKTKEFTRLSYTAEDEEEKFFFFTIEQDWHS